MLLGYPPHCTHALQGLDVVCFAIFKEVWKREVREYEDLHHRAVKADVFTGLFGKAYLEAFTPTLVKMAFEKTGIFPFNPEVIRPEQMRPSETTSVKGSFPVTLPSPVQRVVHALRSHQPTRAEVSPPPRTRPTSEHQTPTPPSLSTPTSPSRTPTHTPKRTLSAIDPSDETPSKRARIVFSSLAESSASFLVHANPIKSSHRLAPPVFEHPAVIPAAEFGARAGHLTREELSAENEALRTRNTALRAHVAARDGIIERAHAQLVIQDLYGAKQRASLHAKENKSKIDRVKLKVFENGMGRHLTADEFIAAFEAQDAAIEAEDAARAQRRVAKADKRAAGQNTQARWEALKLRRALEVAAWKVEDERLADEGVRKKDRPKKPAAARKKELTPAAAARASSDEEDEANLEVDAEEDEEEDEEEAENEDEEGED
jgi:hypothetical protein